MSGKKVPPPSDILNISHPLLQKVIASFHELLGPEKHSELFSPAETFELPVSRDIKKKLFINSSWILFDMLKPLFSVDISSSFDNVSFAVRSGSVPVYAATVKFLFYPDSPKLAIVIDDVGFSSKLLGEYLDTGLPLTFSVMPMERASTDCVKMLMDKGLNYMAHLPMEPLGYPKINPGKAALYGKMDDPEILNMTEKNILSLGLPVGANNHMGSGFTENADKLKTAMEVLKKHNMFILDSKTTQKSAIFDCARAAGLRYLENNVFIDSSPGEPFMRKQLDFLLKYASRRRTTIAIAHLGTPGLLKILLEYDEKFKKDGIELVPVERILE